MLSLCVAALLLLETPTREPAVAMVLTVQGQVQLHPVSGSGRQVRAMDLLYPGDRLETQTESQVALVFLRDRHRERVRPKAQATVGPSGCTPAATVEAIKAPDSQPKAVLEGLRELGRANRGAATVARGTDDKERPAVMPIDGARIITDKPLLSWRAVPKAKSYQVELLKSTGTRVWRAETSDSQLPYPRGQKPLARGREYTWKVYAVLQDEVQPCAAGGFFVASEAEAGELKKLRSLAQSADPAELVLAAVAYETKEMYSDALAVYEKLSQHSPKEPAFHAARAALLERAGRKDDAKKAWAEAEKAGFVPTRRNAP